MDSTLSDLAAAKFRPMGEIEFPIYRPKSFERWDENERLEERRYYDPEKLNDGQKQIFDYMMAKKDHMIVIQGKPGTGKTFTLMSIAYAWETQVKTIIYSHDLLRIFRYNSERVTVTNLFMKVFGLQRMRDYESLASQLSRPLESVELLTLMIDLLAKAKMPDFKNSLIILDHYEIIPKPLLVLLLTLFKNFKISTIICGDKNQLQDIRADSDPHTECSTLFNIVEKFADSTFTLDKNRRCSDETYNEIIDYVSQFSSEKKLDDFGYAIIATLFPKRIYNRTSQFSDTHLAGTHEELTILAHEMVKRENIPVTFYYNCLQVDDSVMNGIFGATPLSHTEIFSRIRVGKFLPYLPLSAGTTYYVDVHSEYSQARLEPLTDLPKLRLSTVNGEEKMVTKNREYNVILDKHLKFLQNNNMIDNYPIYPANFMTIYKYQGCATVRKELDLHLIGVKYQELYVAISHVEDPSHIKRVTIPNLISHLVSNIINFPELHVYGFRITAEALKNRMENYTMYDIPSNSEYSVLIQRFMDATGANEKLPIYDQIKEAVAGKVEKKLCPPKPDPNYNLNTMEKFIDYKDMFLVLSCVNKIDRDVWLREFILCEPNTVDEEITTSSLSYLESLAVIEEIKSSDQQQFVLKYLSDNKVLTTNKFKYDIYKKYERSEQITPEWLIDQLKSMVGTP